MKRIQKVIIHTSVSTFGDAATIDAWHKARGWKGIGYHFVILNGRRTKRKLVKDDIGIVERGRPLDGDDWIQGNEIGSHALGLNDRSIGICLIGRDGYFHTAQIATLLDQCKTLLLKHSMKLCDLVGHYETESGKAQGKTCPDIDMDWFRWMMYERWMRK